MPAQFLSLLNMWASICMLNIWVLNAITNGQDRTAPLEQFRLVARQLAVEPADDCHRESDRWPTDQAEDLESKLFASAADFVSESLNQNSRAAETVADEALKTLCRVSDDIHNRWPERRRFRYEILYDPPVILVKFTFRSRAVVTAIAVPDEAFGTDRSLKRNTTWRAERYFDGNGWNRGGLVEQGISIYLMSRGPSNRARFLVKLNSIGCGSGAGVEYSAYEWNPGNTGFLVKLFHRKGSLANDGDSIPEKVSPQAQLVNKPLPSFDKERLTGKEITLRYCWSSVVDTYNNPTLCIADTYDLSSDIVRFSGREVNRADLYAVAKALQHAQNGEQAAVRAYTASDGVANAILSSTPPFVFNESTTVTHLGSDRELIRLEGEEVREFELAKVRGSWLIKRFRLVR